MICKKNCWNLFCLTVHIGADKIGDISLHPSYQKTLFA